MKASLRKPSLDARRLVGAIGPVSAGSALSSLFSRGLLAAALTAFGGQVVQAAVLDTWIAPTPINANDPQGDPSNVILTYTYTGAKATLKQLVVPAGAQLREVATATFASEARVYVTSGSTVLHSAIQPFASGNYSVTATTIADRTFELSTPFSINSGTQFTFEFYDTWDDIPDGADQIWNSFSLRFEGDLFAPPPATDLAVGGSHTSILVGQTVRWYKIDVPSDGVYRFDTEGSFLGYSARGYLNDTELGLYDADGNLLATNDDIGGGNYLSKIEQALVAGTYYLAAAGNEAEFLNDFIATSDGIQTGNMVVNVTAVPEPWHASLMAVGALGMLRRRRIAAGA